MTIFIGADHRGYHLKDHLIEFLQAKNIRVEDLGNYEYNPKDDYPLFANKVAEAVLQNPEEYLGIVICGSGAGVSMAANRHTGIYSALALNPEQIQNAREHDHINILALASDYTSIDQAKELVDKFLTTEPNRQAKYTRRLVMVDEKKKF